MTDFQRLLTYIEHGLDALPFKTQTPSSLYKPLAFVLEGKAKRMRPLLVLLSYEIFCPQQAQDALPIALAVELFHNFTLIHDDIMDNAPTRRGRPTVHTQWNVNTAILSGDAMFAYAMQLLTQGQFHDAPKLMAKFAQTALEVCEGQAEDMALAVQDQATVEEYLEMIRKKTAVLLGGSLAMGAIAAGAPPQTVQLLEQFGQLAGLAFQIQDDLLDVFADTTQFGKQPGGDILENKKTYLLLIALQTAPPPLKSELIYWLSISGPHPHKVEAVRNLYQQLGVQKSTQQLIDQYFEQAINTLKPLSEQYIVQPLIDLLTNLYVRQS